MELERSKVGRFGAGGINTQVTETLEKAADGTSGDLQPAGPLRKIRTDSAQLVALRLKCFRQFVDASIEFRPDPGRPVCIIEAKNGYGKSHLVEALRWVLIEHDRRVDLHRLLHRYLPEGDDKAVLSVEVELRTDLDGVIRVHRQVQFRRTAAGTWRAKGPPSLTLEAKPLDRPLQDRQAEDWLADRFPPQVLDYFIFDAESRVVQNLSGQDGERLPDVRSQVEAAVGVAPLRKMAKRCRRRGQDWEHRLQELRGEASARQLNAELESIRAELDEKSKALTTEQGRKQTLEGERTTLHQLLAGQRHARPTEEAEASPDADALRARQGVLRTRLLSSLSEQLPLALLAERLGAPGARAKGERRWTSDPARQGARVAVAEIARLVAAGELDWAPVAAAAAVEASLLEALGLNDPRGEGRADLLRRAELGQRALPSRSDLEELLALPARIEDAPAVAAPRSPPEPEGAAAEIAARLKSIGEELGPAERRIGALESACRELNDQAEQLSVQARQAVPLDQEKSTLEARLGCAEACATALDELARQFLRQRLEVLEKEASRTLRALTNKKDLYDRIEIDRDSLRYRILDPEGAPVPPKRSTGERTILALALVSGLRRASGLRFPLFIEAPLKTLDATHQDNVLRQFLNRFGGQTILLVKPTEIPASAAHLIREQVGQRFCLHRTVEGKEETQIQVGDIALFGGTP